MHGNLCHYDESMLKWNKSNWNATTGTEKRWNPHTQYILTHAICVDKPQIAIISPRSHLPSKCEAETRIRCHALPYTFIYLHFLTMDRWSKFRQQSCNSNESVHFHADMVMFTKFFMWIDIDMTGTAYKNRPAFPLLLLFLSLYAMTHILTTQRTKLNQIIQGRMNPSNVSFISISNLSLPTFY